MKFTSICLGMSLLIILNFTGIAASATFNNSEINDLKSMIGKNPENVSFWDVLRGPINSQFGDAIHSKLISYLQKSTDIYIDGDYIVTSGYESCERGQNEAIITVNQSNGTVEIAFFDKGKPKYISDGNVKSKVVESWIKRSKLQIKNYKYKSKDKVNSGSIRVAILDNNKYEFCLNSTHRSNSEKRDTPQLKTVP